MSRRPDGISESIRIANIAAAHNIPVTCHNCTGPLTLFAGLHINAVAASACYQETVRAHIKSFYDRLITVQPVIRDGHAELPQGAGIGTQWQESWFDGKQPTYRMSG